MNCQYHPQNFAVVQCSNCGRALCPACDHRIKGFPYCQDCIVTGIDLLKQQRSIHVGSSQIARKGSPVLAVGLSLVCPGLGAAYNGQNARALAHFGVFVGLFQMAILTNGAPLFVLGFLGMWLFAAVDAFRTARAIKFGLSGSQEDLLTKQLAGNPLVWAISLIGLGVLFSAKTFFGINVPIRELLPVLLVGLGVYWLIKYVQRKRNPAATADAFALGLPAMNDSVYQTSNVQQFRAGKFDG